MEIRFSYIRKSGFRVMWMTLSFVLSFAYLFLHYMLHGIQISILFFILQIPLYIVLICIHEGLHIAWKKLFGYTGQMVRVKEDSTSVITFNVNEPMQYKHFLLAVASPCIMLNMFFATTIWFEWGLYLHLPMFLHNLGCYIDMYLICAALRYKPKSATVWSATVTFNDSPKWNGQSVSQD